MPRKSKNQEPATEPTPIQASAPPQAQHQPAQFTCRKCRHNECASQLRNVIVTVGWRATQIASVSPCRMCTKCGDTTCVVDAQIGDLVDLVPAGGSMPSERVSQSAANAPPNSTAQIDEAIASLQGMRKEAATREANADATRAALAAAENAAPPKGSRKQRRAAEAQARKVKKS